METLHFIPRALNWQKEFNQNCDIYKHFVYYHTIPYSFYNVADIRNLQQYCSIEHYQSGGTKVYDSYIALIKKSCSLSDWVFVSRVLLPCCLPHFGFNCRQFNCLCKLGFETPLFALVWRHIILFCVADTVVLTVPINHVLPCSDLLSKWRNSRGGAGRKKQFPTGVAYDGGGAQNSLTKVFCDWQNAKSIMTSLLSEK